MNFIIRKYYIKKSLLLCPTRFYKIIEKPCCIVSNFYLVVFIFITIPSISSNSA